MRRLLLILCAAATMASMPAQARKDPGNSFGVILAAGPLQPSGGLPPVRALQPPPPEDRARISPSEAARLVQQQHGGRVLAVQPSGNGYRVKVLKDGEVRSFQVNP